MYLYGISCHFIYKFVLFIFSVINMIIGMILIKLKNLCFVSCNVSKNSCHFMSASHIFMSCFELSSFYELIILEALVIHNSLISVKLKVFFYSRSRHFFYCEDTNVPLMFHSSILPHILPIPIRFTILFSVDFFHWCYCRSSVPWNTFSMNFFWYIPHPRTLERSKGITDQIFFFFPLTGHRKIYSFWSRLKNKLL